MSELINPTNTNVSQNPKQREIHNRQDNIQERSEKRQLIIQFIATFLQKYPRLKDESNPQPIIDYLDYPSKVLHLNIIPNEIGSTALSTLCKDVKTIFNTLESNGYITPQSLESVQNLTIAEFATNLAQVLEWLTEFEGPYIVKENIAGKTTETIKE